MTDKLIGREGVVSVGITTIEDRIGRLRRPAIRIRLKNRSVPAAASARKEGVPVRVERGVSEPTLQTHDSCNDVVHYNRDYNPVKGGAVIEGRNGAYIDDGDCTNIGTACARVMDVGTGTKYLLTAHHLIDGCTAGDVSGQSVYQHGDFVGPVSQSHQQYDAVFVGLSLWADRSGFSDMIVETSQPVSGFVSSGGLARMAGNEEEVSQRGINTGASTANVKDWGETIEICNITRKAQIFYRNSSNKEGDSGGPYFTDSGNGENLLVGMHSADVGGILESQGVAAYELYNRFSMIPT